MSRRSKSEVFQSLLFICGRVVATPFMAVLYVLGVAIGSILRAAVEGLRTGYDDR